VVENWSGAIEAMEILTASQVALFFVLTTAIWQSHRLTFWSVCFQIFKVAYQTNMEEGPRAGSDDSLSQDRHQLGGKIWVGIGFRERHALLLNRWHQEESIMQSVTLARIHNRSLIVWSLRIANEDFRSLPTLCSSIAVKIRPIYRCRPSGGSCTCHFSIEKPVATVLTPTHTYVRLEFTGSLIYRETGRRKSCKKLSEIEKSKNEIPVRDFDDIKATPKTLKPVYRWGANSYMVRPMDSDRLKQRGFNLNHYVVSTRVYYPHANVKSCLNNTPPYGAAPFLIGGR